ncbi:MAG TPA: tetratricopeptide repeat protein [Myxococcota bacterium]|nr:tetratricopeptide repeat protein [Myxococcota bacterium]
MSSAPPRPDWKTPRIWADSGAKEPAACALVSLGDVARDQGRFDVAQARFEEAREASRSLDESHFEIGPPTFNLGLLALDRGDLETAAGEFRSALELFERDGRSFFAATSHLGLAAVASGRIEPALCKEHAEAALAGLRGFGFYHRDVLAMAVRTVRGPGARDQRELWTLVLAQAMGLGDEAIAAEARTAWFSARTPQAP